MNAHSGAQLVARAAMWCILQLLVAATDTSLAAAAAAASNEQSSAQTLDGFAESATPKTTFLQQVSKLVVFYDVHCWHASGICELLTP